MSKPQKRLPPAETDLRNFRLRDINKPQYKHLWLLLFWPVYWLRYPFIEMLNTVERCTLIHSILDEQIPFLEGFILPYSAWLPIMLILNIFMAVYDIEAFKKYTGFLIVTFSISTVIFLVFPTYQDLRPQVFPRDNFFTKWVGLIYAADTNTNVLPSEHVIGSYAFWIACLHSRYFKKPSVMCVITVLAILTAGSTVFLKQHSVLDIAAAVPVCLVGWLLCYHGKQIHTKRQHV